MPYEDLGVGATNTGKTYSGGSKTVSGGYSHPTDDDDKPSVIDRVSKSVSDFISSFGSGASDPAPVSGGRGNVYERPNARNDYLAKILSDNAVVPPPSAADVLVGQITDAGYVNPTNLDSGIRYVPNQQQPDYSGNVDRYSIPIGQYIPPNLRPAADYLGLTDLSNLNPVTTMFTRPRDAAARYADPETYSPTGQRETSD